MPALLWGGAAVAGYLGIKAAGDTADKSSALVKWLVLGAVVYLVGRRMKAW